MVGLGAVGGLSAPLAVADRVAGALWGMLIADALAMPTHWFYGGNRQVQAMLGSNVTSYEKAPPHFSHMSHTPFPHISQFNSLFSFFEGAAPLPREHHDALGHWRWWAWELRG